MLEMMEGACRYCGQMVAVNAADQEDANLKATERCTCGQANYEKRKARMLEYINDIFGNGAPEYELDTVSELELELIRAAGINVLSGDVSKVSYDLMCGDTAVIQEKKETVEITRKHGQVIKTKV